MLGGLLSSLMIPAWGWQSVFILGGPIPLVLAAMMYFLLPESMQFLVLRGKDTEPVANSLRKVDPSLRVDHDTRYLVPEVKQSGAPVAELFRHGRARATMLLWIINFMNLSNLYFLAN